MRWGSLAVPRPLASDALVSGSRKELWAQNAFGTSAFRIEIWLVAGLFPKTIEIPIGVLQISPQAVHNFSLIFGIIDGYMLFCGSKDGFWTHLAVRIPLPRSAILTRNYSGILTPD
jgi:hypothetical protein